MKAQAASMAAGEPADLEHPRLPVLARPLTQTLGAGDLATMALYVALSLLGALAGSLAAVLLVPLVQPGHVFRLAGGLFDAGGIEAQAAAFAAASMAYAVLRWRAARLGARLSGRYAMTRRRLVHDRLVDAPLTSLAGSSSAEIANALTWNIEIMTQGFSALLHLLVAGVTAAVSLAFAFWVSPALMLAAPLFAALAVLASRSFGREQSRVSRRYVADMTRLFWLSEEFPRRQRHIRSYEREDAEKREHRAISARLRQGYQRQLELLAAGRLVLELLAACAIAGLFVLARRWPGVDQASLLAVCLLLARLLPYLVSTRQGFQQLRAAAAAFALWQRHMTLGADPTAGPAANPAAGAALRIHRLRVTPPPAGVEVRDLPLVPGEMTLLCGDSGIGKSSLADVLAGLAQPQDFAASVGGRAIGFADYRALVRRGAYVSQDVRAWQPTVGECLRWAAPEASDAALRAALAEVGLDPAAPALAKGLDTSLHGTASRLSGGELQRLLLAQVILRQPFLALLDEATSALDAAAEIEVLAALRRRLPRTILIVVSHRPGVAQLADQRLQIGGDGVARLLRHGAARQATAAS
ncbi:MAG TPA: ABC transporter ATP-binding protein [Rhodanobacteraceae bacterium]|nr:ABC transporter ATP-binding protein [Rhodanobacteraceae bacterium]